MITLDTIIKFAGTDKMLVNAQGTGFESVGIAQRLKSFFNIGDARKRNIDTMSAIRGAIYNDPRFRTADLSEHVQRLLDEVSTDSAIDATRIKSIAKELKSLADRDSTAALDKRVELHLAAGVLPDELRGCVEKHMDQVLFIAKQRTRKVADDVATARPREDLRVLHRPDRRIAQRFPRAELHADRLRGDPTVSDHLAAQRGDLEAVR